jgi:hypothetical protein
LTALAAGGYLGGAVYRWVVFLHVAFVFGFLLAHGMAVSMTFRIRRESEPARIRALLDASSATTGLMYPALGLIVVTGVVLAFMGGWWARWWIWASIAVLILITFLMYWHPGRGFAKTRKAAGLPYMEAGRPHAAVPAAPDAEIAAAAVRNPWMSLAVGGVGWLLILWLMMFKPF